MRFWIPSVPAGGNSSSRGPGGPKKSLSWVLEGIFANFDECLFIEQRHEFLVEKQLSSKHSIRKKIYTK